MKSNVKLLIIGAVVLVLLIGAIVALTVLGKDDEAQEAEDTTAATETLSRLLYEKDSSIISDIHVKNETGEYDIVKYDDSSWFVKDFIGVPHSTVAIQDILSAASSLTADQTASDNAEDLSVYGLASPRADVTITFDDSSKTVKEILVGSDSPSAGLTYVCFKGENTVYAVDTSDIDCYLNESFDFLAKTVYTAKQAEDENDTTDYTKINKLTISRKDIDYDIVLEYDTRQDDENIISGNSATHVMTSPVQLDLNPDTSYDVLNDVFNLTATDIAVVAPTDEIMAQFGLDDPFAEVDFDIVGGNFKLLIGNEYVDSDGKVLGRYCYADGINMIYMFNTDTIPWATVMPLDISMTMITSTYIYSISSIDVATADSSTHFELNGDSSDFRVKCSDGDVTADNFKSFYQFILRAPAEELYLEETDAPADITITITHRSGTDKIEFIKSDDRKTIIRLNDRTSFKCRTSYTSRLIENLGHLLNGEDMVDTW